MRQPLFKRLLSYVYDVGIESRTSDVNPTIDLYLVKGRYQLCTANCVYSFDDLYDNFFKAFKAVDLKKHNPQSILVLGLGLGSIPFMLENNFGHRAFYTMVELDEEIIDLANKYVLDELDSGIEVILADACTFMQTNERKFDLICSDVFVDDQIPNSLQTEGYLEDLKRALSPNGLLMYNRLYRTLKDREATEKFYLDRFQREFPNATYLDVLGNWILMNKKAD